MIYVGFGLGVVGTVALALIAAAAYNLGNQESKKKHETFAGHPVWNPVYDVADITSEVS